MTTYAHSSASVALTAANISSATLNTLCHIAGAEFDNTPGLYDSVDLEVLYELAATPVAGDPINLFILYAAGGTTYEDGIPGTNDGTAAASPAPNVGAQVASIGVTADANAHRINRKGIPILPLKFRVVAYNGTTKNQETTNFAVNVFGIKRETTG